MTTKAKPARGMLWRLCHFTHPETGEVVEGIYHPGRRIRRTVGVRRLKPEELTDGAVSGYDFDQQTFTVPRHVKITIGPKPAAPAKGGGDETPGP